MKPWFPIDCVSWPEIVEMLAGRVWPEWAATADLRWHVDQGARVPPRRWLQARWRWSDRSVRAFLKDTATWWDPSKGPAPESRDDIGMDPKRTQSEPKADPKRTQSEPKTNEQTDTTGEKRTQSEPKADPKRTQSEPKSVHRARLHSVSPNTGTDTLTGTQENNGAPPLVHPVSPSSGAEQATDETTSPTLRPPKVPPAPPVALEAVGAPQATTALGLALSSPSRAKPAPANGIANPEVARVWEAYRAHHPATKSPGKRDIAGAIADHGVDAVLLMVEWVHLDPSEDADYLRRKGYHVNETLWREKTRGRYVYLAEQWQKRGRAAAPVTTGRQLSAREETNNDVDQWLANNRKPQRDVIEAEEPKWIR